MSKRTGRATTKPKPDELSKGPTQIRLDSLQQYANASLPLAWIDTVALSLRSEDDLATLRFFSALPEGSFEAARIQTSKKVLRAMMDILAKSLDYYPTKPTPTNDVPPKSPK